MAAAEASTPRPEPRLDGLGIFWITYAIVYTVLLVAGMIFLYRRRDMPMLRIRGLPLSFAAIVLLHLYWGAAQTAYVYFPLFPAKVEFWVMGIWLPFGIALFHASNSRFLHVAAAQRRFMPGESAAPSVTNLGGHSGLMRRYKNLGYTGRMLTVVGIGMVFQLFLTVFMYLISRKFHRSFGIPGTEVNGSNEEQNAAILQGWEWWPSVFWQVLWAWIFAPIVLWKSRRINDTQGWRLQTVACCIASLHATPMWLVALYVPAMAPVNKYWVPPQWIASSILIIEIFTVFIPCVQVMRYQSLRKETLSSIAEWESSKRGLRMGSVATGSTGRSTRKTSGSSDSIHTMSALEYVLERHPGPLQEFSALRDFSGENIAFLTSVNGWKASGPASARLSQGRRQGTTVQPESVRKRFNSALTIYVNFVSARNAEFQINLSSQDLKRLDDIFEKAARMAYGEKPTVDPATPFEMFAGPASSDHDSEKGIVDDQARDLTQIVGKAQYCGEIPDGFNDFVFDDAEASIKYLVLTNTWPKFIRDRRCSLRSLDSLESGYAGSLREMH